MENSIKNLLTTKNAENAEKTAPLFPFLNIFCALSTGRKNPIKTLITAESVESAEEVYLCLLSSVFSHGSQSNFCKFVRLSESKNRTLIHPYPQDYSPYFIITVGIFWF
jgi:hypothetical protein